MTVALIESIAIVTLNLCTIIAFIRYRNLRKRSMYLVINLAVIDMLAGGISVTETFYFRGRECNLWNWHSFEDGTFYLLLFIMVWFTIGSLTNIAIISLERVHATFFPFKHRALKKWVYGLTIAVVWVITGLVTVASQVLVQFEETYYYGVYLSITFISICLLIVSVSYTSIVIKVRRGGQPQHHGAASRERKLTMTLLIVTVVSLLLCLPYVIYSYAVIISELELYYSLSFSEQFHLDGALLFLLFANSLVNPILYALRMPEYRSALLALFLKRPQQQRQVEAFPLRDM